MLFLSLPESSNKEARKWLYVVFQKDWHGMRGGWMMNKLGSSGWVPQIALPKRMLTP